MTNWTEDATEQAIEAIVAAYSPLDGASRFEAMALELVELTRRIQVDMSATIADRMAEIKRLEEIIKRERSQLKDIAAKRYEEDPEIFELAWNELGREGREMAFILKSVSRFWFQTGVICQKQKDAIGQWATSLNKSKTELLEKLDATRP